MIKALPREYRRKKQIGKESIIAPQRQILHICTFHSCHFRLFSSKSRCFCINLDVRLNNLDVRYFFRSLKEKSGCFLDVYIYRHEHDSVILGFEIYSNISE